MPTIRKNVEIFIHLPDQRNNFLRLLFFRGVEVICLAGHGQKEPRDNVLAFMHVIFKAVRQ